MVVQWSSGFHCQGPGLIQGTEILKTMQQGQKKKKKSEMEWECFMLCSSALTVTSYLLLFSSFFFNLLFWKGNTETR